MIGTSNNENFLLRGGLNLEDGFMFITESATEPFERCIAAVFFLVMFVFGGGCVISKHHIPFSRPSSSISVGHDIIKRREQQPVGCWPLG